MLGLILPWINRFNYTMRTVLRRRGRGQRGVEQLLDRRPEFLRIKLGNLIRKDGEYQVEAPEAVIGHGADAVRPGWIADSELQADTGTAHGDPLLIHFLDAVVSMEPVSLDYHSRL
jgi:hypothetical protein